jgi:hypothetical protein
LGAFVSSTDAETTSEPSRIHRVVLGELKYRALDFLTPHDDNDCNDAQIPLPLVHLKPFRRRAEGIRMSKILFLSFVLMTPCFAWASAQLAWSYSEAKYAYCSTQGYGSIVDFGGTDISKPGYGTARIGAKTCEKGSAITWSPKTAQFTVTYANGKTPQIEFTGTDFSTYVHSSDYGSGLNRVYGQPAPAFGDIVGNSGGCFFITTLDTDGIKYFVYPCN